ncbi:25739_t:CDS:2 [Gigaspora rosea]|nr:25739_t:CDS:2 [Gigaspora rosea]
MGPESKRIEGEGYFVSLDLGCVTIVGNYKSVIYETNGLCEINGKGPEHIKRKVDDKYRVTRTFVKINGELGKDNNDEKRLILKEHAIKTSMKRSVGIDGFGGIVYRQVIWWERMLEWQRYRSTCNMRNKNNLRSPEFLIEGSIR